MKKGFVNRDRAEIIWMHTLTKRRRMFSLFPFCSPCWGMMYGMRLRENSVKSRDLWWNRAKKFEVLSLNITVLIANPSTTSRPSPKIYPYTIMHRMLNKIDSRISIVASNRSFSSNGESHLSKSGSSFFFQIWMPSARRPCPWKTRSSATIKGEPSD